jgi:hypothetical protein
MPSDGAARGEDGRIGENLRCDGASYRDYSVGSYYFVRTPAFNLFGTLTS